jgi:xanthine dehydrogenase accessory factor
VFEIALTVQSCLRANTRVDVAWVARYDGPNVSGKHGAIAITPGGGKMGSILSNTLDEKIAEHARRQLNNGVLLRLDISSVDALINGVAEGGRAACICVPASQLPVEIWSLLIEREPLCITSRISDNSVTDFAFYTSATITGAPKSAQELFAKGNSASAIADEVVVSTWFPITRLVIAGLGPIAEALNRAAQLLDWNVSMADNPDVSTGMITGLSPVDATVIIHHSVEDAGRALASALDSRAGYIGAVGSSKMQSARADWLAYRGYADLSRIHGPAGLSIGAKTPAEIAVSILAEAVSDLQLKNHRVTPAH